MVRLHSRQLLLTCCCCPWLLPAAGMCCPEFAKAMLDAVPYAKLGTTAQGYLEK